MNSIIAKKRIYEQVRNQVKLEVEQSNLGVCISDSISEKPNQKTYYSKHNLYKFRPRRSEGK